MTGERVDLDALALDAERGIVSEQRLLAVGAEADTHPTQPVPADTDRLPPHDGVGPMTTRCEEINLADLTGLDDYTGVYLDTPAGPRAVRRGPTSTFWVDGGDDLWVQTGTGLVSLLGITAYREVEEHPNGIVPSEQGSMIQLGDGTRALLADPPGAPAEWMVTHPDGMYEWASNEDVQALADEHGFEVAQWGTPGTATPEEWAESITVERERQRQAGYTAEHDAEHEINTEVATALGGQQRQGDER